MIIKKKKKKKKIIIIIINVIKPGLSLQHKMLLSMRALEKNKKYIYIHR